MQDSHHTVDISLNDCKIIGAYKLGLRCGLMSQLTEEEETIIRKHLNVPYQRRITQIINWRTAEREVQASLWIA